MNLSGDFTGVVDIAKNQLCVGDPIVLSVGENNNLILARITKFKVTNNFILIYHVNCRGFEHHVRVDKAQQANPPLSIKVLSIAGLLPPNHPVYTF